MNEIPNLKVGQKIRVKGLENAYKGHPDGTVCKLVVWYDGSKPVAVIPKSDNTPGWFVTKGNFHSLVKENSSHLPDFL